MSWPFFLLLFTNVVEQAFSEVRSIGGAEAWMNCGPSLRAGVPFGQVDYFFTSQLSQAYRPCFG
jgi:hypothetical protein